MLVEAPVSSMKTRRAGFSRPGRHAIRHGPWRRPADPARRRAVSFFERELQVAQPVPQAPDADLDLALDRKPTLQFFECCIRMGGHPRAQCFIMGCKLRFASRPAEARCRLAGRLPSAKRLVDVGDADPKQWRNSKI